jgi:hypothetical protein
MSGSNFSRATRWLRTIALCVAASVAGVSAVSAQDTKALLDSTLDEQARIDNDSQRSQITVAQLAGESSEYFADYRVALQQLDRLRVYNDNLQSLVNDQEDEKRSVTDQLDDFGDVEKGIVPFMYDMISSLRTFVELDMPFSVAERHDRVQRLEDNMERSDLTVSEKYRQIMEAYQIETSFGRTIEAYTGTLAIDGEERKVDLLRVGRVLLAYQTPDRSRNGFWDGGTRQWVELDDSYRRSLSDGLRIARKQAAPMLLELPLPAPERVQ